MNSGDISWILASLALVLLMTPGVAFFYGGLVRRKNAAAPKHPWAGRLY